MTGLADGGWVAPGRHGPSRRTAAVAVAGTAALLVAWAWLPAGWSQMRGEAPRARVVVIDEDGRAAIGDVPLRRRLVARGGTRFLLFDGTVAKAPGRPAQVRVQGPAGLDADRIALRRLTVDDGTRERVLVTVPAAAFPGVAGAGRAARLASIVEPVDRRIASEQRDARLHGRLRGGWWVAFSLGILLAAAAPLLAWRCAARRFHSMRQPGPGRTFDDAVPPSSLDPVGAALLCAGAGPVDHASAFAGHVLDLVDRRQLRMRRREAAGEGGVVVPPGVRIRLPGDEDAGVDDPAVAALRSVADPGGETVDVPDEPGGMGRLAPAAQRTWIEHVSARARFERILDRWPWRGAAAAAATSGAVAVAAVVAAQLLELPGQRAAAWLVAAVAAPAGTIIGGWASDARRWRVVTRARRVERAQWIAWRVQLAAPDAPEPALGTLPLLVATGRDDSHAPTRSAGGTVALEAVTAGTIRSLRAAFR